MRPIEMKTYEKWVSGAAVAVVIALVGGLAVAVCKPSGARPDKAPAELAHEEVPTQEQEKPTEAIIDPIDDSLRQLKRFNVIADLISAHQKIYRDEGYAGKYKAFIRSASDPAEIADLQDDLSEIRNDIRDTKAEIPKLEAQAEALSKTGDPSYRLELAQFNADLAEAVLMAAQARREGSSDAERLEAVVDAMQKSNAQSVLNGSYPKAK